MTNRWGKMETVTDFIFLGSKINTDSDFSHETKRCLFLGRNSMTNIESILPNDFIARFKPHAIAPPTLFILLV